MSDQRYCPQCSRPLERVYQDSNSMLNSYQFDAVKAGDWFCKTCPTNDRGKTAFCYWWDKETLNAAAALTAAAERETAHLEELKRLRVMVRVGPELDNHHNAAVCPYCNPDQVMFSTNVEIQKVITESRQILREAAERETALREENERLQATETELSDRCSERGHAIRTLEAEVERLNGELDKLAITLSHEANASAAERQKVQALREFVDAYVVRNARYDFVLGAKDVRNKMDDLGLPPDPPREK